MFCRAIQGIKREHANPRWLEDSKIQPLLDEGFICLGDRLQVAELPREQHHPLLLDGQHHFTKLLILQTHIRLHHLGVRIILSELREEFWILRARQTIKQVLHSCLPAELQKGRLEKK